MAFRAQKRSFAALLTVSIIGMRLAACGGDDDTKVGQDGDGSVDRDGSFGSDSDIPVDTDGSVDEDGSAPDAFVPPAFCSGLVLYSSFDNGIALERGTADTIPYGQVQQADGGKFGNAVLLDTHGGGPDASAAVYYVKRDGGPAVVPEAAGSISLWYRAEPSVGADQPVIYRTVGSILPAPLVNAGLSLVSPNPQFGLYNQTSALNPVLAFPKVALAPYLRQGGFNHYATAWREGDAGGQTTAMMVLNGGLGQRFDMDASAPDATPDGSVPYRASTKTPWNNPAEALGYRLGGPTFNSAQGAIDDFAVWDRVLSFEEMAEIYKVGLPIRQACRF